MGEFECVGSGESEARERLNGDKSLYATGGMRCLRRRRERGRVPSAMGITHLDFS